MTLPQSISYLEDKEIGECIFRPSSLGENWLTLTWKFYTNVYMHVNIKEEDKILGNAIGSKLIIGKEEYDSLAEIETRYVRECLWWVFEAKNHHKFRESLSLTELEESLKLDLDKTPTVIPYKFTILIEYPGFLILGYLTPTKICKRICKSKTKGLLISWTNISKSEFTY